ncbi:hypothetical protein PQX77_002025 [Marasmius sp. AFHP31]|nr:hypothetical protein PQX77_002025 [Marasmius sp. AFHP31]
MLGGSSIQDAFPQSDTTPVVPHIIENDTGWPLNLSGFTEPLLKIAQSSETDILAFVSHCHPSTIKTVYDVFERIQNSLAGDVVCGIPEPKTSIIGPFIGKILREAIPDADFYYDVEYAKGMYPCNFRQPGKQLIRNTGTANVIVTKPLPLSLDADSDLNPAASSSVMERSWSPPASGDQSLVSSHLTSPPVSPEHKTDSAPILPAVAEPDTRHTELAKLSPTSSRVGSEVSSRMAPAGARLRSSYTRRHDPSDFMGTLQDISRHDELMDVDSISTLSSEPSEGEGSESIESDEAPITHRHLHLIAHHPPSLNLVSFPFICVASHAEIYSLLAGALMHRRVYGVLSPLLGLALDPVKCRLQLVYAWLETPGTHICIEAHAVHAPSSLGIDHASGVFDMRIHSSVVSLTAYLLEIASTLLASIDDVKTASLPGVLSSRAWRLNALPLDIETHEENLLEQWLSEIITFHQSPAPTFSKRCQHQSLF